MSTPAVTRDTGLAQFKLDLKAAMQTAGIEGTPTVFYVEDHQVSCVLHLIYLVLYLRILHVHAAVSLLALAGLDALACRTRVLAASASSSCISTVSAVYFQARGCCAEHF
jgi:hypothetical protein